MSPVREVRFETVVHAKPEAVFEAVATADGFDGWFTCGTTLEPTAGGELVFRWPADSGGYMTTVTIEIEQHEEGCLVRLVEGTYEDGEIGVQDMLNRASGWAQALTLMKFWVEHGVTY